jgi:carbon-monoxide dehydrogenase medium subunit
MKAAKFDYIRPGSVPEVLACLAQFGDDAQILAGGQSLMPMMNLRLVAPQVLIDITRLPELQAISESDSAVSLGACTTHAAIEDGIAPDPSRGLMPRVASDLAYRAVRTRGTIGGSLALADPAAEWPTVLSALDAKVVLHSPRGERSIAVLDFVTGIFETAIERDEILHRIVIPRLPQSSSCGYVKFSRKTGAFADSIAVAIHDPSRRWARIVLGAANGPPLLLATASKLLLASAQLGPLQDSVAEDLTFASSRSFDAFQTALHTTIVERAIAQALQ